MVKIIMFVYVNFFLSLFLFGTNINAISECEEDGDCPRTWCFGQFFVKCITNECICVHEDRLLPWIP
ncbi:putative Late nodulin [Medicago truncatula]|uniref:Putative Late nodulin n=1 Tax=Medicago truncatula TaxID=3880 RepID=A0A396JNL7_MEDTR|nr:putative Late nodulin [Medicago truncatula]